MSRGCEPVCAWAIGDDSEALAEFPGWLPGSGWLPGRTRDHPGLFLSSRTQRLSQGPARGVERGVLPFPTEQSMTCDVTVPHMIFMRGRSQRLELYLHHFLFFHRH